MFGQRQQPQKPPPHGTMTTRSQAARRREKLRPDADIFKITVLGLAKTGKTSLCTQAVNHFFPEVYRHTPQTDSFITRVKVANGESRLDMVYTPQNDQRRSGGPAKSNIPAYQLELQDTPGELWRKEGTNGLGSEANRPLEHTPEHRFTTELSFHNPRPANPRQFPRKADYQTPEERYRENVNIIFGDYEEAALLRAESDSLLPPSVPDRDNSNHLLRARPTMGYIVVFDPNSRTSFEKAKRIIAYARLQHHPRTAGLEGLFLPLFLFANKMDLHIGKMRRGTDSMNDQNQDNYRRYPSQRLNEEEVKDAARRKWEAATNAFEDEDPPLLEEAKAWVDKMCTASSRLTTEDNAQQMKAWSAYNLNSKFVQLCYGSVKLNQVRFWDEARAGVLKEYRLEELFNRMASQMVGQLDFVQRVFAKAENLGPSSGLQTQVRPVSGADGPRRRRKPRKCNYCLCFLWVTLFPIMLLVLLCKCCWRGCSGATPVYIPDQDMFGPDEGHDELDD
eukprot:INCI1092.2.p1 GENE.INCI1092.2~~INCI1092.2.p1  ORF type:complete len:506 (+),score=71.37 INCI1092.2:220-1737(+)